MVRKIGNIMMFKNKVTEEMIHEAIGPNDGFAKTFIAKCNMLDRWDLVRGIVDCSYLASIILMTYSKRLPKIANLQLLHTFYKFRGNGYARNLCELAVFSAYWDECSYFRVSAEPEAVEFYKKIGFKFIGRQKSGCQLSMFKLASPVIEENKIVLDSVIESAIYSNRKGGCVEVFREVLQ